MFDSLTGRLSDVFDRLRKRGALSEADVDAALRDVRVALLEADVALSVVRDFIAKAKADAMGENVLRSVTPGQMVIKVVNDALIEMLGGEAEELNMMAVPPVGIMLVGLQGSGKTTTAAKIGLRLQTRDRKKVMMASLDTQRPAAQEQLKILGEQAEVATLPVIPGQGPVDIAKRALESARLGGYDVVLYDTAGRLSIDEALMSEMSQIRTAVDPHETLLVADAMTGQDAVNVAERFHETAGLTGIVLTRVDGDGRGGAALSMRAVTGCPIKLIGIGMGDVVSLVEKAAETIDQEEAEALAKKIQKGQFDLEDMSKQLQQMRKMGGLSGLMDMLPGAGKMKDQMAKANIDERMIGQQEAIISSMTKKERSRPKLIHASRKRRIAAGSGTTVQDVNKLLKQFQTMSKVMKRMSKMGKKGMMRQGLQGLMPGMSNSPF
jgi:signal recognition particle subunit SRP54